MILHLSLAAPLNLPVLEQWSQIFSIIKKYFVRIMAAFAITILCSSCVIVMS